MTMGGDAEYCWLWWKGRKDGSITGVRDDMEGMLSTVGCGGKEEKMDPSQEVGMTMRGRLNTVGCGG